MNNIRKTAEQHPEMRKHLVPILKQASWSDIRVNIDGKKLPVIMDQAKWAICHKMVESAEMDMYSIGLELGRKVNNVGDGTILVTRPHIKYSFKGVNIDTISIQYGIMGNNPSQSTLIVEVSANRKLLTAAKKKTFDFDKTTAESVSDAIKLTIDSYLKGFK